MLATLLQMRRDFAGARFYLWTARWNSARATLRPLGYVGSNTRMLVNPSVELN